MIEKTEKQIAERRNEHQRHLDLEQAEKAAIAARNTPKLVTRLSQPEMDNFSKSKANMAAVAYTVNFPEPEELDWYKPITYITCSNVLMWNFANSQGQDANFDFMGYKKIQKMIDPTKVSRIEIGYDNNNLLRAFKIYDAYGSTMYESNDKIIQIYVQRVTIEVNLAPGERWLGVRARPLGHDTPASLLEFQIIIGHLELDGVILNSAYTLINLMIPSALLAMLSLQ